MSALPIVYAVDASIAPTGAFVALRHAAQALKQDIRMVLVLPEGSLIPAQELSDFARVEYIPMVALSKNPRTLLRYLPALIKGTRQLKQRMQADGATTLWLNDFYLMHGAALKVMGYACRTISVVRCFPRQFAGPLAKPMLILVALTSQRVLAVSQVIAREIAPLMRMREEDRPMVLYDYFAGQLVTPLQANRKSFLYVGNYIEGKGQDMALEAFARLAAVEPLGALRFYGGDMGLPKNRAYRERLEKMAEKLGISGRVTFHDFTASLERVFAESFAALNFSRAESFSMTVLEASGAGLPVIATDCGGPREIIREGETGFLIPVGDVNGAAKAIIKLASDPVSARQMGEAGAAHVAATFSKENYRHQMLAVLSLD